MAACAMLVQLVLLGISILTAAEGVAPPCDVSKPGDEVCADFCSYKCGFFNASAGEDGRIKNRTLYRLTPPNVTGIRNKDTGDAPGDVTFWLSKKNLTQQCAKDPTGFGCFLDGDNLYGAFLVEMDTQFGPYFECNPINIMGKDPKKPLWVDTRRFDCGQGCLFPTPETGCKHPYVKKNGTFGFGGAVQCFCDGTGRQDKSVGIELTPFNVSQTPGPRTWPAQCFLSFYAPFFPNTNCVRGQAYKQIKGWNFASAASLACDACSKDKNCQGWATLDNATVQLFEGTPEPYYHDGCIGGFKYYNQYGSSWGAAGDVGGYWYSTPVTAECAPGQAIGTDGCTWRVLSSVYKNASCIDGLVDTAVERHGQTCFDMCSQPLNRTSTCYLYCYRDTLLGHPGLNITKMNKEQIVHPWEHGFVEDDPNKGGCPPVRPDHCEGPQCPAPTPPDIETFVV